MKKNRWSVVIGEYVYKSGLSARSAARVADRLYGCVHGLAIEPEIGR